MNKSFFETDYKFLKKTTKLFLACLAISFLPFNANSEKNNSLELSSDIQEGLLTGQYLILLRHALAPGFGDPGQFEVNDCNTQRNLSEAGREQARNIGNTLKNNGIRKAAVFSSQWCRCLETARLLNIGAVTELPFINSFFQRAKREKQQTMDTKSWITEYNLNFNKGTSEPAVLVTHQVNITALTGIFPRSGELVIVDVSKSGEISVKAQLQTGY